MGLPLAQRRGDMVFCGKCKKPFAITSIKYQEMQEGDLTITWFPCPICGWKYHVVTMDEKQRELVAQRKKLVWKIGNGRKRGYRPKTIAGYQREIEKIKKEQNQRKLELTKQGQEILHRGEE